MFSTRLVHGMTLAALVAALAGCESKADASADARDGQDRAARTASRAPRDPCSLITKEEADAILGTSFTVRPATNRSGPPTCEYTPATGTRLNGFTISVHWTGGKEALAITKGGMRIATSMMKAGEMDPTSMMALEPVAGLGDEAYFNPMVGSSVLEDDTLLEFDIRAMMWHQSLEDGREVWKQLVSKALARL